MRRPAVLTALVLGLTAPALGFVGPVTKRADLDADGQPETVRAVRVDLPGVEDRFDRTAIQVTDVCPGGRVVRRRIAGPQDNLSVLRLHPADTRPGEEVFVELRSGAPGRLGEARVVAWRRHRGFPCRGPRDLFRYLTDRHTRTPRGGTGDISSFLVRLREVTRRYRGLEVALDERFLRPRDPSGCGSIRKVTYLRYSRGRDRYVRYRTKVVAREALAMYVVATHRITDPEKFFSMDAEEVAGGGPPGVQGRQFFPSTDRSSAVRLWEADSIDTLRNYLDPATEGVSENTYFEIDTEYAMGIPEAAAAEA